MPSGDLVVPFEQLKSLGMVDNACPVSRASLPCLAKNLLQICIICRWLMIKRLVMHTLTKGKHLLRGAQAWSPVS